MTTDRFDLPDGRAIGFADHGAAGDLAVLWCHGGPGSRLEPEAMAQGVVGYADDAIVGYADDRIADGPGWGSFDVASVRCPVEVIHGAEDTIVPLAHAQHTAEIVPGARLTVDPNLGHLSIITEVVPAIARVRERMA